MKTPEFCVILYENTYKFGVVLMIGYYNYTVILTYISLVSSIVGIFFAAGVGGGEPQPDYAVICLMISGLCDMFDGKIARTRSHMESEKNFGIQIDSLCDLVCFGVLPAVIGYSIGMKSWFDVPVLVLFPLCAVIRLAYFNVAEEEHQKGTDEVRKVYEGLPVTSALRCCFRCCTASRGISAWNFSRLSTEPRFSLLQLPLSRDSR